MECQNLEKNKTTFNWKSFIGTIHRDNLCDDLANQRQICCQTAIRQVNDTLATVVEETFHGAVGKAVINFSKKFYHTPK